MSRFWKGLRVVVTGGEGFVGSHLIRKLKERDCTNIFSVNHEDYDLRKEYHIKKLFQKTNPDIILHLAARVGGIGANMKYPGTFFYDNLVMGVQLMEYARQYKVKKFVAIGTVCAYPKFTPIPFKEEDLWNGYPEETNAPYGLAKKMLLVQSQAYRKQYGFNSIYLLPVNLYGPGDNYHPDFSHVIPALIDKCIKAIKENRKELVVWGTGTASREFLYVEDCAEGILLAAEYYNKEEPINLGAGREITIRELVNLIVELTGFRGSIVWDTSKPDGQPRRCLDTSKAFEEFGYRAQTDFREGLRITIEKRYQNLVNKGGK